MADPLLVALEAGSARAIPLLADRLERLAGLRQRMLVSHQELADSPPLRRAAKAVVEALDTHMVVLQSTLREVQDRRFEPATQAQVKDTWERLVALQLSLNP